MADVQVLLKNTVEAVNKMYPAAERIQQLRKLSESTKTREAAQPSESRSGETSPEAET